CCSQRILEAQSRATVKLPPVSPPAVMEDVPLSRCIVRRGGFPLIAAASGRLRPQTARSGLQVHVIQGPLAGASYTTLKGGAEITVVEITIVIVSLRAYPELLGLLRCVNAH